MNQKNYSACVTNSKMFVIPCSSVGSHASKTIHHFEKKFVYSIKAIQGNPPCSLYWPQKIQKIKSSMESEIGLNLKLFHKTLDQ